MELNLDLTGQDVLVIGTPSGTRRVVARVRAAGAVVTVLDAADLARRLYAGNPALPRLVVWVEGPAGIRRRLAEAARTAGALLADEAPVSPTPRGLVTLIGGGPGDPELLTLAGRRALAEADVVLYDRLGPRELLAEAAPGAELVDVGKTPGHHAVPQHEIEAMLVEHALRGLRVVRLKGGDPFVFGRGGEEVLACRRAGVPVTVVPGVTSAISVPAAAGIPVTHREVSRAFTVISGHAPFSEDELEHLVGLGGTLVVLMGVTNLPHLAAGLQRHGMPAGMPLAIIERGYSPSQRATVSSVGEVTGLLGTLRPSSPAVIVVGEVVRVAADADRAGAAELLQTAARLAS
ncbi:uroporphyrinogen-III C-methyltransferase [Naasia sp. SYSU D00948]|uniref:uroporphyrinogen-III C-methyltransferase n=1 Tax=Naasia sp. SYSU D00948 TaxID=2817379 RepID=UPI001B305E91|nr:uroporphyrinogen-III C-methyltransferase [Naasia sp. SYSU D00948]